MAQIAKITVEVGIKSHPAKLYDFFKNKMTHLSNMLPHIVKKVELIEGQEGQTGNIKFYEYVIGTILCLYAFLHL